MSPGHNGLGDATSSDRLLACGLAAAAEARAAVDELRDRLEPELLIDLRLLVSELVTNSVEHGPSGAGASVRLSLSASVERVRVEVRDAGNGFTPPPSPPDPTGDSGRGLWLIDRLADRWGVEGGASTSVWAELDPRRPPDGVTHLPAEERLPASEA